MPTIIRRSLVDLRCSDAPMQRDALRHRAGRCATRGLHGEAGSRGCSLSHAPFQTSTIDALLDGEYVGDITFAELEGGRALGLGTLDALDGEMIALDGSFYQIRADAQYPRRSVGPKPRRTEVGCSLAGCLRRP